jgi:ribonuclease-3
MEFPFSEIEKKIGYSLQNKGLLQEAFTHSTYANAYGGKDNERLEYLGDAVLQLVVTEWQYNRRKSAEEGELTRERQKLVCEEALLDAVETLKLQSYLLVSGGRANVGKKTISSLFETVIAAIYLDGGYEAAKQFILTHGQLEEKGACLNYKGKLQEYLQQRGKEPPRYETEKSGMDNAPVFRAIVTAGENSAHGEGGSKKEAEQQAAKALLDKLTVTKKK